ncbi:hypothetical protein FIM02_02810 [SAR202 cluster bacterium AD-802-E10_MRT_200m]|nr:hypothetical protein [SAR202 cluster bacterium AD-802-E10_MRT_200m]
MERHFTGITRYSTNPTMKISSKGHPNIPNTPRKHNPIFAKAAATENETKLPIILQLEYFFVAFPNRRPTKFLTRRPNGENRKAMLITCSDLIQET